MILQNKLEEFTKWGKYLKVFAIWEKMCYNKANKWRKGGDTNGK